MALTIMVFVRKILYTGINVKIKSTNTHTNKPMSCTHQIVKQGKQSKHAIDREVEALDFGISPSHSTFRPVYAKTPVDKEKQRQKRFEKK